jgi:hypothetical protein
VLEIVADRAQDLDVVINEKYGIGHEDSGEVFPYYPGPGCNAT